LRRLNLDLAQLQHHLLRARLLTSLHIQLLRSWLILSISPVQSQPVTSANETFTVATGTRWKAPTRASAISCGNL
ncbi:hypothetical protein, partial [Methylobacterium haplocladii]|uniref:hypothetical protein n=1 Tax=Methylobacterium haplocladii TaxID=1176176 RepID=UPI0024E16E3F